MIQNTTDYVSKAEKELSNLSIYKPIEEDITPFIVDKIKSLVKRMVSEGDINSTVAKFILPENPKPSRFYTLPKTHKNPTHREISPLDQ